MDPLERGDLVQDAVIAGNVVRALLRQERMGQEAEDAQPVIDRDQDDAFSAQTLPSNSGSSPQPPV